jgi:ribonuclease-3 family protein
METNLSTYSTAALAYLGDCVLELCVREYLVKSGISSSAKLNREALNYVRAGAQADAMKNILPLLTEEEEAVFRRGRNVGHTNTPKSATVAQYRNATGMEALFGWLHLAERQERIRELFEQAYLTTICVENEKN